MPSNNRKKWRIAFTIKGLLALTLFVAIGFAMFVTPRLRREQAIRYMEKSCPSLRHVGQSKPDRIDRLLGIGGSVSELAFMRNPVWPPSERLPEDAPVEPVSADTLLMASQFSPIQFLRVESLELQLAGAYPQATKALEIIDLRGEDAAETLTRLLSAQSRVEFLTISKTAAFTDDHIASLAALDHVDSIQLMRVPITGLGFQTFHNSQSPFRLSLINCPITPDGMKQILACPGLSQLHVSVDCKHADDVQQIAEILQVFADGQPSIHIFIDIHGNCEPDAHIVGKLSELRRALESFDFVWR